MCVEAITPLKDVVTRSPKAPQTNYLLGVCYLSERTLDLGLAKKHLDVARANGVSVPSDLLRQAGLEP